MADTREESINEIISSIAMEELALSHIINAEGEKLQYALGTLAGSGPVPPATLAEVLSINNSINATLKSAAENQIILKNKLEAALSSAVLTGPTGATGATGADGADGIDGINGTDGVDGASATIAVGTVTEIPYGQTPTVENVGTSADAVLNFGLPAGAPPVIRVYKANLSTATSPPLVIPLGSSLNYELRPYNVGELQLFLRATGAQVLCDYRIVSQYNETSILGATSFSAMQGNAVTITTTSGAVDIEIYGNSQETHQTWVRVQNLQTATLWSTYEIKMFCSGAGARVIAWVTTIDENGQY